MELHSSDSGDVVIKLQMVELESVPSYEATSYVWGDPNVKVSITCEGSSLKVTPNLKAALQHLRPEIGTRVLWADADCSNQEDLEERSQQVRIMSRIYAKATRSLVWLGTDGDENTDAFTLMKRIREFYLQENSIAFADIHDLDSSSRLKEFGIDKLLPIDILNGQNSSISITMRILPGAGVFRK
jgi:hypothetical protein